MNIQYVCKQMPNLVQKEEEGKEKEVEAKYVK